MATHLQYSTIARRLLRESLARRAASNSVTVARLALVQQGESIIWNGTEPDFSQSAA